MEEVLIALMLSLIGGLVNVIRGLYERGQMIAHSLHILFMYLSYILIFFSMHMNVMQSTQ